MDRIGNEYYYSAEQYVHSINGLSAFEHVHKAYIVKSCMHHVDKLLCYVMACVKIT